MRAGFGSRGSHRCSTCGGRLADRLPPPRAGRDRGRPAVDFEEVPLAVPPSLDVEGEGVALPPLEVHAPPRARVLPHVDLGHAKGSSGERLLPEQRRAVLAPGGEQRRRGRRHAVAEVGVRPRRREERAG